MVQGRARDRRVGMWVDLFFLIACVLLGAWGLASTHAATRVKPQPHQIGDKISVPGVDFSEADRTLLLFILNRQSTPQSLAFYAGLTATKRDPRHIRIIALVGNNYDLAASKRHLQEDGVVPDDVIKTDLDALKVFDLPTIILVDRKATLSGLWRLRIDAAAEQEVRSTLF